MEEQQNQETCEHSPSIELGTEYSSRIVAMNGKTVEVDNTDAEGRLVLSGERRHKKLGLALIEL